MDYLDQLDLRRHDCFEDFEIWRQSVGRRLVLATTAAEISLPHFMFRSDDVILVGRESAGVPPEVHAAVDARVRIPLRSGLRSLNVAVAASIVLFEALRQTGGLSI